MVDFTDGKPRIWKCYNFLLNILMQNKKFGFECNDIPEDKWRAQKSWQRKGILTVSDRTEITIFKYDKMKQVLIFKYN